MYSAGFECTFKPCVRSRRSLSAFFSGAPWAPAIDRSGPPWASEAQGAPNKGPISHPMGPQGGEGRTCMTTAGPSGVHAVQETIITKIALRNENVQEYEKKSE